MNTFVLVAIFAFFSPFADEPLKIDVSQKIMHDMTLQSVQPQYPAQAAASGLAGPVVVAVTVGTNGALLDAKARCGYEALNQAALDAVRQWKFRPVAWDGKPAEVHGNVVVDFAPPASAAPSALLQVSSQDAASHLLSSTVPQYPSKATQGNIQGCVVVQSEIGADGKVQKTKAVSGNPLLLKAAETCVAQWTYKPFTSDGSIPRPAQSYAIVEFSMAKPKGSAPASQ
jgi:TonB family protein